MKYGQVYILLHQLRCSSSQFSNNKDNYYTLKVCEYIFLQSLHRATAVDLIYYCDNSIWKRKRVLTFVEISYKNTFEQFSPILQTE